MVVEAGFSPNKLIKIRLTDDELLEKFADLTLELGHVPSKADRLLKKKSDPTFPSSNVFMRLGTKNEILLRLIAFAGSHEEYENLTPICEPYIHSIPRHTDPDTLSLSTTGFVYMIRMDKWHKIGATKDILRRTGELRITLPSSESLVHTIETDDPFGVEKYWHNRFKDRRARGEWFLLTPADVKAFRKWRRIH